jgi:hypothetical protein
MSPAFATGCAKTVEAKTRVTSFKPENQECLFITFSMKLKYVWTGEISVENARLCYYVPVLFRPLLLMRVGVAV